MTNATRVKRCSKCKRPHGEVEFYKCSSAVDGLQGYCKVCANASGKGIKRKRRLGPTSLPQTPTLTEQQYLAAVAALVTEGIITPGDT